MNILKHANEVRTGFNYIIELFDPEGNLVDSELVHNLVPTEGLNHIAGVVFKSVTPVATWYIGLFEGDYTPLPAVTAATISALSTETTAYTPANRVEFVEGTVNTGAVDNTASKAEFTFTAAKTIYGGFIVSSSPRGSTTGTLVSAVRFSSPKVCDIGSVLRVTTGVAFTSI